LSRIRRLVTMKDHSRPSLVKSWFRIVLMRLLLVCIAPHSTYLESHIGASIQSTGLKRAIRNNNAADTIMDPSKGMLRRTHERSNACLNDGSAGMVLIETTKALDTAQLSVCLTLENGRVTLKGRALGPLTRASVSSRSSVDATIAPAKDMKRSSRWKRPKWPSAFLRMASNCAQSVVAAFLDQTGLPEQAAYRTCVRIWRRHGDAGNRRACRHWRGYGDWGEIWQGCRFGPISTKEKTYQIGRRLHRVHLRKNTQTTESRELWGCDLTTVGKEEDTLEESSSTSNNLRSNVVKDAGPRIRAPTVCSLILPSHDSLHETPRTPMSHLSQARCTKQTIAEVHEGRYRNLLISCRNTT